ncbi:ASCH domain-containing protein [Planococcus kocurii]|uniref:ASCH domain-containing protein n=1 Tax=Planococcus kocurii TaxID=1374 RepID=A0ABM5WWR9_9BACL|nr:MULTISPECIES: ASCH domain-containing protein [Planococcus]ALS78743.1 hypothetical protein AUO94_08785 [Planococcus kocurii]KAA0955188.1 ASCH domain-containing protein [Planococcus sp. ANT_H30]
MEHTMGLYDEYVESIIERKKKVEVRLNDEKRRKIKIGDTIKFIKIPSQNEVIRVVVLELKSYPTFQAMYEDVPFSDFDCEEWTMEEMIKGTFDIYSVEQEQAWGALAIGIKLI